MAKSHPRWRLAKKVLTWLFFIAVVVLLVVYAKKVDWGDVWTVIRDYNRTALLSAVGLVISLAIFCTAATTCLDGFIAAINWRSDR